MSITTIGEGNKVKNIVKKYWWIIASIRWEGWKRLENLGTGWESNGNLSGISEMSDGIYDNPQEIEENKVMLKHRVLFSEFLQEYFMVSIEWILCVE